VALAGPTPSALPCVGSDPALAELRRFKAEHVYVGRHNEADVQRGFERIDFAAETRPLDTEGIAENGHQLHALCAEAGVNHLIYTGFAINWCILLSPGGMAEMSGRGFMCSAIRQATSAVENRETAREERCKEIALWRVALAYGFVFDVSDFIQGISVR
jgi:nicotinamidase-related amidase